MNKTISTALLCGLVLTWILAAAPARGQPILERLERQIRQRSGQASDPAAAAEAGPLERRRADRRKAAAGPAEPAFLGAVVDDKNDRPRGARVTEVRPGGPAAQAGVRPQDLITGAGAARVRYTADLTEVLKTKVPGDKVVLEVRRGVQRLKLEVTLGQRPVQPPTPAPLPGGTPGAGLPPQPIPGGALGPGAPDVPAPPGEPLPAGPAPEGPQLAPPGGRGADDAARIEQLQRRVEQLEQRVQELERAMSEARKN